MQHAFDKCVLIVDDETLVADVVRAILGKAGWNTEVVYDPRLALDRFGDGRRFSLVISDMIMPGMNGCELACKLREARPDLPVLFISGNPAGLVACQCPILAKPFSRADLLAAVDRTLRKPVPDFCTEERKRSASQALCCPVGVKLPNAAESKP